MSKTIEFTEDECDVLLTVLTQAEALGLRQFKAHAGHRVPRHASVLLELREKIVDAPVLPASGSIFSDSEGRLDLGYIVSITTTDGEVQDGTWCGYSEEGPVIQPWDEPESEETVTIPQEKVHSILVY